MRQALAAGLCILLAFGGGAEAACRVEPRASVPVQVSDSQVVVGVALNGQDTPLLVDTGAARSLLTAAAVQQAALPLDEWVSTPLRGAGNRLENRRNVMLRSMALGGLTLQRRGITNTISLPVTAQRLDAAGRIAGLLGADMLSRFDIDLDVPGGRMTLYTVTACSGRFLPWKVPYDAIAARHLPDDALIIPVLIDGHPLDAQLDTGAQSSLINGRGLHSLGLTPEALAHDPETRGVGIGGQFVDRRHRFGELRIGAERIVAPVIRVAALPRPGVDMLLGMDVLGPRRIWISYATAQVFIANP